MVGAGALTATEDESDGRAVVWIHLIRVACVLYFSNPGRMNFFSSFNQAS